jgi:hypothetical protein
MGFVLLLSFVGVFTIPGSEEAYIRSFYDVWTDSDKTRIRDNIQSNLKCCGWTEGVTSGCSYGDLSRMERCRSRVMEQVDSFRGGLRFVAITFFVTQFLFSVLIGCFRRETANLESESP